ncbi:hypothetical protein PHSC3_000644 [Chlamydiales bacterium STE3]|nr:hypothetical protein PHSC3_000644 [Chlamydiales bacterium STE3]
MFFRLQKVAGPLVGTIKDTMAKTKYLIDEEIFNSIWGIKKKMTMKERGHEHQKV